MQNRLPSGTHNNSPATHQPAPSRDEYPRCAFRKWGPTEVFDTLWKFATERQAVFYRRLDGLPSPWTSDPTLATFKFTNAYRATDRVSQFLIQKVIYSGDQSPRELFFRIILFKLFNKIETWQLLASQFGEVSSLISIEAIDRELTRAM